MQEAATPPKIQPTTGSVAITAAHVDVPPKTSMTATPAHTPHWVLAPNWSSRAVATSM